RTRLRLDAQREVASHTLVDLPEPFSRLMTFSLRRAACRATPVPATAPSPARRRPLWLAPRPGRHRPTSARAGPGGQPPPRPRGALTGYHAPVEPHDNHAAVPVRYRADIRSGRLPRT